MTFSRFHFKGYQLWMTIALLAIGFSSTAAVASALIARGRMVVISDIDDTLKTTHVRATYERVLHAPLVHNRFYGMSDLYRLIERETGAQFYYVTNAPKILMEEFHEDFLEEGGFPQGAVHMKRLLNSDHKINSIRKILNRESPDLVLFFGDNGEKDVAYYDQIVREFSAKGLHFVTFIRVVYNAHKDRNILRLKPDQINFVTPVEVLLKLQEAGLVGASAAQSLIDHLAPHIVSEERPSPYYDQAFPQWLDCGSFSWPETNVFLSPSAVAVRNRIHDRCKNLSWIWANNFEVNRLPTDAALDTHTQRY